MPKNEKDSKMRRSNIEDVLFKILKLSSTTPTSHPSACSRTAECWVWAKIINPCSITPQSMLCNSIFYLYFFILFFICNICIPMYVDAPCAQLNLYTRDGRLRYFSPNGFPRFFIESCIRRFWRNVFEPKVHDTSDNILKTMYFSFPYFGSQSEKLMEALRAQIGKYILITECNIALVNKFTVGSFLTMR